MIHYHGAPLTPEHAAAHVFKGRHAMISFAHPEQLPLMAEVCQTFALDNGAFSAWRSGSPIEDWEYFYAWVEQWKLHPGFDWFLIPDKIDGDEADNDELLASCPHSTGAVPVWHLHESLDRLERLVFAYQRIALGSSGSYAEIGTDSWWHRMDETFEVICNEKGQPMTKIHGLRMLDPKVFRRYPFSSCDSTNTARNVGYDSRWNGTYAPPSKAARGVLIAERIESHQSIATFSKTPNQLELLGGLL